jgi:eukaryotic-like serine/threonine-protein kinase
MSPAARFGKYQLVRRIGVGGMAEVYEAALLGPAGFSKRLALKLMLPKLSNQPDLVSMFIDEASIAASLDHPNIVAVYEFGESEGTYFMVMEYVDGWELAEVEQCCLDARRPFPIPLAAFIVRELCRGLAYIHGHERGIVHRDVSPHNVFISRLGHVKLADFGIAKAAARRTHTQAGHIKGKLAYLAPEQATGEPVTARTDVYAAGLILFELLAGRLLIQAGSEVEHITMAMNPPRIAPSSLRPEAAPLDAVVARALERHPVMRFPGAAAMAAELDRFLEQAAAVRPQDLAAFVVEATADLRPPHEVSPLTAAATPPPATPVVRSGRSGSGQAPRVTASPGYDSTLSSLSSVPKHRLPLFVGGGLLVAGLVGGAAALVYSGRNAGPGRADGATARDGGRPPADERAQTAREASPAPAQPRPDAERRPRPVTTHKKHRTPERPTQPAARAPDARAAGPSATELARARRQRLQSSTDALLQQARSRGLYPGDDSEADRTLAEVRRALQSSALDAAEAALGRLRARAQGFQIDRSFAERKLRRLEKAIADASGRLPEADRQRMATGSQAILRLIMDGRLVEASAQMSRALSELGRR